VVMNLGGSLPQQLQAQLNLFKSSVYQKHLFIHMEFVLEIESKSP